MTSIPAAIDAMWSQVEPTVFITRAQWERGLDGWSIETVDDADGVLAFVVLTRGPEFHFTSFRRRAAISMRMIRERLAPLIMTHGFAETRTPKDDVRQRRFNEVVGFRAVGEDEFYINYRIENLERRKSCP